MFKPYYYLVTNKEHDCYITFSAKTETHDCYITFSTKTEIHLCFDYLSVTTTKMHFHFDYKNNKMKTHFWEIKLQLKYVSIQVCTKKKNETKHMQVQ